MTDGQHFTININGSTKQQQITYYDIEIAIGSQIIYAQKRYSELRKLCQQFKADDLQVRFPQKQILQNLISRIFKSRNTSNKQFLKQRFNQLKKYFSCLNKLIIKNQLIYRSLGKFVEECRQNQNNIIKKPIIKGQSLKRYICPQNDQTFIITEC